MAVYGYPRRVSVALAQPNFGTPAGTSAARSLSADMRLLAFSSYAGNFIAHDNAGKSDVFVLDRDTRRGRHDEVDAAPASALQMRTTPTRKVP